MDALRKAPSLKPEDFVLNNTEIRQKQVKRNKDYATTMSMRKRPSPHASPLGKMTKQGSLKDLLDRQLEQELLRSSKRNAVHNTVVASPTRDLEQSPYQPIKINKEAALAGLEQSSPLSKAARGVDQNSSSAFRHPLASSKQI